LQTGYNQISSRDRGVEYIGSRSDRSEEKIKEDSRSVRSEEGKKVLRARSVNPITMNP
jgi:hypothetical protein